MNPDLSKLQPYPFEKLAALKAGCTPPTNKQHIALSIGEPQHSPPGFVTEELITHLHLLARYPLTQGTSALRTAIADWLTQRYRLPAGSIDAAHHILPVNGTREALFAFAQTVVERGSDAKVLMPNPFYQIYEGAALLAGAQPWYINTCAASGYLPDFASVPESVWSQCQLLYLCSPGNPTGAIIGAATLKQLLALADEHDFVIAADECYSEIYFDEKQPPTGLLEVAASIGRTDYARCVVFHSLSKRSNLPGLRSGFVAGDAQIIKKFLLYRTYHGCVMPLHSQAASVKAWQDESHVVANRALYREKFAAVVEALSPVMDLQQPQAGFYLWPKTPIDDAQFARLLFDQEHVTVLPGSYLSRDAGGINPGQGRIRMALVASIEQCMEAAERIRHLIERLD